MGAGAAEHAARRLEQSMDSGIDVPQIFARNDAVPAAVVGDNERADVVEEQQASGIDYAAAR